MAVKNVRGEMEDVDRFPKCFSISFQITFRSPFPLHFTRVNYVFCWCVSSVFFFLWTPILTFWENMLIRDSFVRSPQMGLCPLCNSLVWQKHNNNFFLVFHSWRVEQLEDKKNLKLGFVLFCKCVFKIWFSWPLVEPFNFCRCHFHPLFTITVEYLDSGSRKDKSITVK